MPCIKNLKYIGMRTIFLLICCLLSSFTGKAATESYKDWWVQVEQAEKKDLPRQQIATLDRIAVQATKDKKYGQLLKAQCYKIEVLSRLSADSVGTALTRLQAYEQKAEKENDILAAIYQCVLGRMYESYPAVSDNSKEKSQRYFKKSLSNPELLATTKIDDYEPFIKRGKDGAFFGNDLLSVIAMETRHYDEACRYYKKKGMRVAALFADLENLKTRQPEYGTDSDIKKSAYLASIDSLLQMYGDLKESGEIALWRYAYMQRFDNVTIEDKISYINYALKKWGNWFRMAELRNEEKQLTAPMFTAEMENVVALPGKENTMKVTARNVDALSVTLMRLDMTADRQISPNAPKYYAQLKPHIIKGTEWSTSRSFAGQPPYKTNEDSIKIKALPVGVYLCEVKANGLETRRSLYYVSNLYVINEALPEGEIRYAVVNATTGQPVANATVRLTTKGENGQKENVETYHTNKDGELIYTKAMPDKVFAYTAEDKACPPRNLWNNFWFMQDRSISDNVNLFTDRGLYRPGQTVHVAAVAYKREGVETKALTNKKILLTLRDNNWQEVGKCTLTTDEYGTASHDFTLPASGMTGDFTVTSDVGQSMINVRVEEYKRPTFMVEFPKVNEKYEEGDTLVVTGYAKSYAGIPVQGAKVTYTVKRQTAWWWRMWTANGDDDGNIAQGTAATDEKGAFKVTMPLTLPEVRNKKTNRFYNITVNATVTDVGGESHEGMLSVPLSDKPSVLYCNVPDQIERDSLKQIRFTRKNAAGEDMDGTVSCTLDNQTFTAKANEEINLPKGLHLASGKHHLLAICENDTVEKDFVVFSLDDKRPAIHTHDWFYQTAETFPNDGKAVAIQVGTSDEDTHVFYTIVSKNNVIEKGAFDISNEVKTRKFTYDTSYGDGIVVSYAWVKDGKLYTHSANIGRPVPDKRMKMAWTTFRNRLAPGQEEEWTLRVTRPDGTPATAQLMATLYDKSLDQLYPFNWTFTPMTSRSLPWMEWRGFYKMVFMLRDMQAQKLTRTRLLDFNRFSVNTNSYDSDFLFNMVETRSIGENIVVSRSYKSPRMVVAKDAAGNDLPKAKEMVSMDTNQEAVPPMEKLPSNLNGQQQGEIQLRENLNETAFFFPALVADEKGEIKMRFTLPESITTWKFMGFAHDKDMNHGMMKDEVVAKKTVMVQPNVPRFVRTGDKASIATRLFNTSEGTVKGTVKMELIDPETEKVVTKVEKAFTINANGTASEAFDFTASEGYSLLICRITAYGTNFSDGEQQYMPMLSNTELVTNSITFDLTKTGKNEVNIADLIPQKLVPTVTPRITVEYADNPAWMAIQALPYVAEANQEDAMSVSAAYYANAVATWVIDTWPRIGQTFKIWQKEDQQKGTLQSNLEKNQELKQLLLNDTPWMADAKNEKEGKQRLARFFDKTNLDYTQQTFFEKLNDLQNPDGSWSWWKGMEGNEYVTLQVAETLARLNAVTGKKVETETMLGQALECLGKEAVKTVSKLKKEKHPYFPGLETLHYLYVCTLDGRKLPTQVEQANSYLIELLQKANRNQNIYSKALAAVVLKKTNATMAKEYVQSIKEYTVYKEGMGRYFDTPRALYSWMDYRIASQVAAMEAIRRVTPADTLTLDEMGQWLMQQKRTQQWDSPINSVNAVYAIVSSNGKELQPAYKPTNIAIDGKEIAQEGALTGTGYIKTTLAKEKVLKLTIDKHSPGTSWGAVYAQAKQALNDVEGTNNGLTIRRELIGGTTWKVGDKVKVRITITADRDYDFVQVVDKRAACLEPVNQLTGYRNGSYCSPRDYTTQYYFDKLTKGKHVIESEYYADRKGSYTSGTCTVQCAYSPDFQARDKALKIEIK